MKKEWITNLAFMAKSNIKRVFITLVFVLAIGAASFNTKTNTAEGDCSFPDWTCSVGATTTSDQCDESLTWGIRCQVQFPLQEATNAFIRGSGCQTPLFRPY